MNIDTFKNYRVILGGMIKYGVLKFLPERLYLKLLYKFHTGKSLNLKNPITFNEKLQWLKLYDRNELYAKLVDKVLVRKYIKEKLGEEYLIPCLGIWNKFEEINFNDLPNQFVLKCSHDSGSVVVCKDKKKFDYDLAKEKLTKALKLNYYYKGGEWPYKIVKPRIIAEKYMTDDVNSNEFTDYKFYCFNGMVDCVMVCLGRLTGNTKFYFFDKNWQLKRLNLAGINAPEDFSLPKPYNIEKMFEIAGLLSKDIPFVRIDLYQSNNKIYFGEFTFYPCSGYDRNYLKETELYFGNLIKVNDK